jgi:hypothetical protein
MPLCAYCKAISIHKMSGPDMDRMYPHQPSFWTLKLSGEEGCQLCSYIWESLYYGSSEPKGLGSEKQAAWSSVCERYPGRQISLCAWGGASSALDRIQVITTGDIP